MNIKEAKQEIENAVRAYLMKDKYGRYRTETVRQRPLLMIGAPGIGKTAIMEQIALEMQIGLISYSMTHHTRQSAIGLPFIEERQYGETTFHITEYTMGEIVASIYEFMKRTGLKEGILFLDEINCVSETLTPAMLQFLQYKTFGNHPIPGGWVIVCAGNPPEYNKSVRTFDVATLDRVRKIMVEPDYDIWKEYALDRGVHPAVTSYLDVKRENFYRIENTPEGKAFATARGWEDLSEILWLYEELGIEPGEQLASQYLQDRKVSRDFAVYLALFYKYKSDYRIPEILRGKWDEGICSRASAGGFDERLSLLSLLLDAVTGDVSKIRKEEETIARLQEILQGIRHKGGDSGNYLQLLQIAAGEQAEILERELTRGLIDRKQEDIQREVILRLESFRVELAEKGFAEGKKAFSQLKKIFGALTDNMENGIDRAREEIDCLFRFVADCFGEDREMLVVLSELTARPSTAKFISEYGSDAYFKYNESMLFYQRQTDVYRQLREIREKETAE